MTARRRRAKQRRKKSARQRRLDNLTSWWAEPKARRKPLPRTPELSQLERFLNWIYANEKG